MNNSCTYTNWDFTESLETPRIRNHNFIFSLNCLCYTICRNAMFMRFQPKPEIPEEFLLFRYLAPKCSR